MKELNIKNKSIQVEHRVVETKCKIKTCEPEIFEHESVRKRYKEFEDFILSMLKENNIPTNEHCKNVINDIIIEYAFELDTDSTRNEILHKIKNNPLIKKEIRKEKLNEINGKKKEN